MRSWIRFARCRRALQEAAEEVLLPCRLRHAEPEQRSAVSLLWCFLQRFYESVIAGRAIGENMIHGRHVSIDRTRFGYERIGDPPAVQGINVI